MGLVTFMPAKLRQPKAKAKGRGRATGKRVTGKSKQKPADKSDSEDDCKAAQDKILKPIYVVMFVL